MIKHGLTIFFNLISDTLYGKPYQEVLDEEAEQVSFLSTENASDTNDDSESSISNAIFSKNINNNTDNSVDEASDSVPSVQTIVKQ